MCMCVYLPNAPYLEWPPRLCLCVCVFHICIRWFGPKVDSKAARERLQDGGVLGVELLGIVLHP